MLYLYKYKKKIFINNYKLNYDWRCFAMELKYTKMQGLGNDFIIIDNREYKMSVEQIQNIARIVCTRKLSVGADGLMAIDYPDGSADFKMRFFNADGSIGEMCG